MNGYRHSAVGGTALFAVLLVGKLAAIGAVGLPRAAELPQLCAADAVLALLFAGAVRVCPCRGVNLSLYAVLALHAAIAAAVVQAIGTPPTLPMLHGVDPAMGSSAGHYLRPLDLAGAAAVLTTAVAAPFLAQRLSARTARVLLLLGAVSAALLPIAGEPSLAAHRNALVFLLRSARDLGGGAALPVTRPMAPSPPARTWPDARGSAAHGNVVVVVLESAAARFLPAYGSSSDPMPFVSALAARSLLVERCYAVYPESIKGQIAMFHAVHPAPQTDAIAYAKVPVPGLATLLGERGHATGLFHAGRFRFLGMRDVLQRSGFTHLADAAAIGGHAESSFGVDEESVVDALLAWVDGCSGQPFLAAYLPVAGHHPYDSPAGGPFPYDTELGCYRNALHYADRALQRLWAGITARGLAPDTLLVVVGDHGEAFGEHAGNFGHTFALYEENLRVPLLFHLDRAPGLVGRLPAVASHADLAPTILDLLGLPPCAAHEGSSLLAGGGRPALFCADYGCRLVGVCDGPWKLIADCDSGREQLFCLQDDPGETRDLAAEQPARTRAMAALARGFFLPRRAWVQGW